MSDTFIIEICRQALHVALLVAAPMLAASLIVGILVSLVQVATSLQDATLTFVPKILAVAAALILAGNWIIHTLLDFTRQIFAAIPAVLS
jgi:flagellar biosynthesis protein FliQ